MKSKQVMVLMYSTILLKSKEAMVLNCKTIFQRASKQAMVLNCKTIFQASKQVSKQASKSIFTKTGLTKIPSLKQAYGSEVFRTCTVVLGYHLCILDLSGRKT